MKFIKRFLIGSVIVVPMLLAGAVVFGTTAAPPRLGAINDAIAKLDMVGLPAASTFQARDGARITYRTYQGDPKLGVLLIHGSTARSESLNELAKHLAGFTSKPTVYTIDIRGHGLSGTAGDIGYIGQLEHDIEDFLKDRAAFHSDVLWRLAGFSAGGGFALRVAGSPVGESFEKIVLISPMLDPRGPTYRPDGGGWAAPYIPRIVALSVLGRLGITTFHGLPAIAFAKRDDGSFPTYSYRLLTNFGVGSDWATYLKASKTTPHVLIGEKDELFVASAYEPMLKPVRPEIRVDVVSGLGHMDMTLKQPALDFVAKALGLAE